MANESQKKIVYIDMDNVMVDFKSGIKRLPKKVRKAHADASSPTGYKDIDDVSGIFGLMEPYKGAIKAFKKLSKHYDVYLLSTAPWKNPSAWHDKVKWVHDYLGADDKRAVHKRLIISHHKNLNRGHFLIDDRIHNGADKFAEANADLGAEHIWFGPADAESKRPGDFANWKAVLDYLIPKA
jgi:5'(3')-deoxyribonucleotidase